MSIAELNTTGFGYALQANCTGTDASIGASQSAEITQKIEAQNLQLLQYGTSNAKSITLAFWVKSSKTGTYCIAINKKDSTAYNISHEYTISSADTWEKKVIHISPTAGSTSFITSSAGAIANDNGEGLYVVFALAIGSNYHGANNTWTASSSLSTSNQVNWMDNTNNNFYLTGVQLEVGEYTSSTLPPFQHESFGDNLARCQRYFVKIETGGSSSLEMAVNKANPNNYNQSRGVYCLAVPMRSGASTTLSGTVKAGYLGGDFSLSDQGFSTVAPTYGSTTDRVNIVSTYMNQSSNNSQHSMMFVLQASSSLSLDAEL
tara:strand:- start:196 stop:1149 length:954 start_codon:yes stop_codon:yes gene_type:complete